MAAAQPDLAAQAPGLRVFPSLLPQGFFAPVLPPASVDVALAWSSLNYLASTPRIAAAPKATPAEFAAARHAAFRDAGHRDLARLLRLRAAEVRPGGFLVAAASGAGLDPPSDAGAGPLQAALMRRTQLSGSYCLFGQFRRTITSVSFRICALPVSYQVKTDS